MPSSTTRRRTQGKHPASQAVKRKYLRPPVFADFCVGLCAVEATVCPASQQVVEKIGKNKISADHKTVAPDETRVPDTHLTLPTSSSSCAKTSERGVPKAQFVKKKEEAAKARAMRAALRDSIRARSSGADESEGESAGVASSEALSNRGVKRRWKAAG